jgi:hypothetical protein
LLWLANCQTAISQDPLAAWSNEPRNMPHMRVVLQIAKREAAKL